MDAAGWLLLGAFLASSKARSSGKEAIEGIEDKTLRFACEELLKGKPGASVANALRQFGVNGSERIWEQVCHTLTQRGKAAKGKRLARAVEMRLAAKDLEGALDAARELCEGLGG